jgi:hypothetical protein
MSLNSALVGYLSTHPLLQPIVETRIYPSMAPQRAPLPYIVYHRIWYRGVRHLRGASRLASAGYQWDLYETTTVRADALFEAFRLATDGLRGTFGGQAIRNMMLDDAPIALEDEQAGDQSQYVKVMVDTTIWFIREVTTFA